jgi:capsid protein
LNYWLKPNTNVNEDVRKFFNETLNDLVYQSDTGTFFLTDNKPENLSGNIVISQMTTEMSKLMLQLIASGLGLAYSTLARDLEDLNFSTSRIIARLDKLTGLKRAKKFAKSNFQKSYNKFIESIVTNNLIDISLAEYESNRRKYEEVRCYINHPVFDDPNKDINFKLLALKAGVKTLKQILEEDGVDWIEQLEQMAKESNKRKELGIENDLDKIHFEINTSDEQNGEQNDK